MSLFDRLTDEALRNLPNHSPLPAVVEKELLHHDILREMNAAGLLASLTFIGGTCLRACYGSSRLGEDLDFTGGTEFTRDTLATLGQTLVQTLEAKYSLAVRVSEPVKVSTGVDTWKIAILTHPGPPLSSQIARPGTNGTGIFQPPMTPSDRIGTGGFQPPMTLSDRIGTGGFQPPMTLSDRNGTGIFQPPMALSDRIGTGGFQPPMTLSDRIGTGGFQPPSPSGGRMPPLPSQFRPNGTGGFQPPFSLSPFSLVSSRLTSLPLRHGYAFFTLLRPPP